MGAYTVELDAANAPITVNNFVVLARYHYFDSTICHRAIKGFMVQCGDPSGTGTGLEPGYTIADELPATGCVQDRIAGNGQHRPAELGQQPVLPDHRR